jgi:hypothetical protein
MEEQMMKNKLYSQFSLLVLADRKWKRSQPAVLGQGRISTQGTDRQNTNRNCREDIATFAA